MPPKTKTVKQLWEQHRDEFIRLYSSELIQKIGAKNLEYRYTDLNNVAYFGFPKDMAMSVERLGKLYYFSELLFKGLSAEEDEKIDQMINEALEMGLSNPKEKSAAKIGSLLIERDKRRKLVFHSEIIYNLLAVQWVREDEDPGVFSNEIQMQKVDQFKKEVAEKSAYPFFQVPELKQLNSFFNVSKDEWTAYWHESLMQQETLKIALEKVYTSVNALSRSKKILQAQS